MIIKIYILYYNIQFFNSNPLQLLIMQNELISPIILTILDGWGHSEKIKGNAIKLAHTPNIDKLWKNNPHCLLNASGEDVGLPNKQMGNSEVGHTTIGAGRSISQDLVRISHTIENKTFFTNELIHTTFHEASIKNSKVHLIGLCSDGGVHSHINHLIALIEISKQYQNIETCIHIITDGRDTQPYTSKTFITIIENHIKDNQNINICTISGRYYSMDRDCRWSRTEKAYKILTNNTITTTQHITDFIDTCYEQGISDEFIQPTRIYPGNIKHNDNLIFFNFRPDRMRQMLHIFAQSSFKAFPIQKINNLSLITFTQYDSTLNIPVVFSPQQKNNFLGEIISNQNLKQFRLAETEKYAHVTYFFNGGREEPFPGEDRELIPSVQVNTYDLEPKMSAKKLTSSVINALQKNIYHLIIINYANPDMVGHTGNLQATINAISTVDQCIQQLTEEVKQHNGILMITADHGNADYMLDQNNKPCTSHSTNQVPFIFISHKKELTNEDNTNITLKQKGSLKDIAPTILDILNIQIPKEMNGHSLINKKANKLHTTTINR